MAASPPSPPENHPETPDSTGVAAAPRASRDPLQPESKVVSAENIASDGVAADVRPSGTGRTAGFAGHAVVIAVITLVSRVLGLLRESVAAAAYGAGGVWSAFTFAFTIPNLFRKLFGEGALSAAFIPLYAQAVRRQGSDGEAKAFAAASVRLLMLILLAVTLLGEGLLWGLYGLFGREDYRLAVRLTAIMLPYVVLVCGTAFLGGILQVHGRFAAVAATSIVLNAALILGIVLGAWRFDLTTEAGQMQGAVLLSVAVVVSGVVQVGMLVPGLRAAGFRVRDFVGFAAAGGRTAEEGGGVLTPAVRKMLWLSVPVALSAGILQLGVLLDKGIAFFLAAGDGQTHFHVLGHAVAYPMAEGAAARLNWAQFMYQFPLGVFAIALATAIFPKLAGDAMDTDRTAFRTVLRQGLLASVFIGLPASVGMVLVAEPAVQFLFERGRFTAEDTRWVVLSTSVYSSAIWAFSVQQILSRAYYALHDMRTPLWWAGINLVINLVVELPLIFTPLGEAGMAVGTLVSFAVQAVAMTWLLSRRIGGIGLRTEAWKLAVMAGATAGMAAACVGLQHLPMWPAGTTKAEQATELVVLMTVGAGVYGGLCWVGGLSPLAMLRRRRRQAPESPGADTAG